jgi:ATP-dependent Clp protease ATP-binding subunit ClpA
MSGVIESPGTKPSGQSLSTKEQAQEKVQETAQQMQDKAVELKGQAGGRVRSQIDTRTTEAGTQLRTMASAMRRTGQSLRQEGNQTEAKLIDGVANRAERLGEYMTNVDADRLLRDVEDFGRKQPWLLAFGGATIGFFASRFIRASSGQRFASGSDFRRELPRGGSPDGLNIAGLAPAPHEPYGASAADEEPAETEKASTKKPGKLSGGRSGDQQ